MYSKLKQKPQVGSAKNWVFVKHSALLLCFAMFLCITTVTAGDADKFVIIVNKGVEFKNIDKKTLSKMFLKKTTKWDDGSSIKPVDQTDESEVRSYFSDEIHEKKTSSVKAYWQKQIFSGRGVPPIEESGDQQVLTYVSETPGAIGYISTKTDLKGHDVKVVELKK